MSREELLKEIDHLKEQMFLEQMRDYMDHKWYAAARDRLKMLEDQLHEEEQIN